MTGDTVLSEGPLEPSDEALMLAYAAGEATAGVIEKDPRSPALAPGAAAFETLYRRHRDALYRYLLRGCQSKHTAQELFQDVWQKLIQARLRYRADAPFGAYLYKLAHNRLVDHWRSQRSQAPVAEPELENLPAPESQRPDETESRRQQAARLLRALATLPPEQREIIVLREEQELTLEQIAVIQGVGRETVKSRLRYALAKLREVITHD